MTSSRSPGRGPAGVAVAGGVLAAAALAGGCAPERAATLPPAPAVAPSSASGAARAAATTHGELVAEAVAAARAYYAALDVAVGTGRVAAATALTTAGCSCRRLLDNIAAIWRSGSVRGDRFFVVRAVRPRDVSATVAQLDVVYDGQPYDVLAADGTVSERVPPRKARKHQLELVRGSDRWWVHDVRAAR